MFQWLLDKTKQITAERKNNKDIEMKMSRTWEKKNMFYITLN